MERNLSAPVDCAGVAAGRGRGRSRRPLRADCTGRLHLL